MVISYGVIERNTNNNDLIASVEMAMVEISRVSVFKHDFIFYPLN